MFIDDEAMVRLTGYRRKSCQIRQLKAMGLPFFVNASGHPVVAEAVAEGRKVKPEKPKWVPSWAGNPA